MACLGHCSDNTERNQKHLIVLWLNLTGPLKLILLLQKQFHQNLGYHKQSFQTIPSLIFKQKFIQLLDQYYCMVLKYGP